MAIDAAAAAAGSASTATSSSALGRARLAESFDTFLTLLTTQMKNQDPLSPLDSNQFTQQIVQMTGVEQQLQTNDLLQKLVSNTGSGISAAVSLIGKDVRAVSANGALKNGQASWVYKLDSAATDVKVQVLNSAGEVVTTIAPTDNSAGEHAFTWNGKDAAGRKLPDGDYTLKVTAATSTGEPVTSTIYQDGVVTGVEQVDGKTLITINGAKVSWDVVTRITQAQTAPAATTASNQTSGDQNSPTPVA